MSKSNPKDLTSKLRAWSRGEEDAIDELMEAVNGPLRRLAFKILGSERSDHTLQPTALVNECFMKLIDQSRVDWNDRIHFFAISARIMRRILADYAKRKGAVKRGKGCKREFDVDPDQLAGGDQDRLLITFLELDEGLEALAEEHPDCAEAVDLFYYGGLSYEEIAKRAEVSVPTVTRRLRFAKSWLKDFLQ